MGVDDGASQQPAEHLVEPDEEDVQTESVESEPEPVPSGLARFIVG